MTKLSHSPIMDVRLLFKRADDLDLELWTTADFLGKASGYYKALFASGSTETVTRSRSKRQRGPSVTSEQTPLVGAAGSDPKADWEDSDDETDAFLVERDWMNCTTTKQDTADFDYQQVEVRETAYSTMCAILLYLHTGHIKFAPIRSSHALPPDELVTKRKALLTASLTKRPTLPPPVSPKSVYRLAHLLERDELQKLALNSLASSLTITGAADELFSPVSLAYDNLRKVVVDFVVKNWKEVKVTESWRAARARVTSEPTEGGGRSCSTCSPRLTTLETSRVAGTARRWSAAQTRRSLAPNFRLSLLFLCASPLSSPLLSDSLLPVKSRCIAVFLASEGLNFCC